ncbi:MAG: DUF6603 domain-containing protein [Burkholderiales bacterium]
MNNVDDKSILQHFANGVADFVAWLVDELTPDKVGDALSEASGRNRAFDSLAEDLGATTEAGKPPVYKAPSTAGLKAYRDAADPGIEAWIGVINDVRALYESIRAIIDAWEFGSDAAADEVTQRLIDLLVTNYVRQRWPKLYTWMEFARFSTEPATLYGPGGSGAARFGSSFLALIRFLLAPVEVLGRLTVKGPDGAPLDTEAQARKLSDATLLHAAGLLAFATSEAARHSAREVGYDSSVNDAVAFNAFYGWEPPAANLAPDAPQLSAADRLSDRMLSVQLRAPPHGFQSGEIQIEGALRASLAWVPKEHGGPGLFVSAGGTALRFEVDRGGTWLAQAETRFDAPVAMQFFGKEKFRLAGPVGDAQVHAHATLMSREVEPGQWRFRFSVGKGNGLLIGRAAISAKLDAKSAEGRLSLLDCRLALDGTSFDDFIGELLPAQKTTVDFSFGTGYSTSSGFFTTGDLPLLSGRGSSPSGAPRALARDAPATKAALQPPDLPVLSTGVQGGGIPIQIPIGKSLGPVRLHHVLLNLDRDTAGESPRTLIGAALSFSAQIGPVLARTDRIGLKFALDFPDDKSKANLHFANLDVGFLPPAGIGLAVDSDKVKGGGFLFRDEANHQYAGVMELSLSGIVALKAIGLISTRLPDGSKGYSLVILVTAESSPEGNLLKNPVMGFRLTGVGGLIAIHRTVSEEALRAGLKNRTLESLLFPKDPVRNAPTIIAALNRVFPIRRGTHLIGLMVRLVWGVPTIITFELGVILEWAGSVTPSRLVILGRITSILPRPEHDLLRLNLDAVGIFDFERGTAAIDAVLVDSRLLNRFPLTGSGALRARWTSPRSFALSVGGMNKGFTPPTEFPKLDRLALSLTTGDNPRLTCEAYFALTANTVQYGAHVSLYAAAYGFNVQGEASYDVLIRLVPFHFLAEFYAGMQLRKGSRNLFKVKVEGALEGPLPLAVRAKCTFEVLWWDVSIRVNVTLVGGARPPLPVAVDASAQLSTALNDARSWSAELPPGQSRIVSLRAPVADGVVQVHPLGTLAVRQSVVPLNLSRDIDKFGDSPVVGARRFAVTGIAIEGATQPSSTLNEDFAPGQFFEMSDEARIASPSFEPMQAGLRIGASDIALGFAESVASPLDYETRIVDRSAGTPPPAPARDYRLSMELLGMMALHGAAGRSSLRRDQPSVPAPFTEIQPPRWSVATDNLALLPDMKRGGTFVEALGVHRGDRQRVVVREFELTGIGP